MQQWARVYLDYARIGPPRKQARIQEYMCEGVEKFRLQRAIGTIPFLLHVSVFLFFAGLIDFLLPVNTVVAYSALGCMATCAFGYVISTFLPIWYPNCPYRTPLSGITYISYQLFASSLFWAAKLIEGIFHGLLMEIWRWFNLDVQKTRKDWLANWIEDKVATHYDRFLYGLQCRVELGAKKAKSNVGANALRWTLAAFNEEKECEDFVACMPGFFHSSEPDAASTMFSFMSDRPTPDAASTMLSLMPDQPTPKPILEIRLLELLSTCLPAASSLLTEGTTQKTPACVPDGPVVLSAGVQLSYDIRGALASVYQQHLRKSSDDPMVSDRGGPRCSLVRTLLWVVGCQKVGKRNHITHPHQHWHPAHLRGDS